MLDSCPGIRLEAAVQLKVIVDPFWVYCPEPLARAPETVWFCGLPGSPMIMCLIQRGCTKMPVNIYN